MTPRAASMLLESHARLDRQRMRDALFVARVAQADEKAYARVMKDLNSNDAPRSASRKSNDPKRVGLAEQAKRRKAGKSGST